MYATTTRHASALDARSTYGRARRRAGLAFSLTISLAVGMTSSSAFAQDPKFDKGETPAETQARLDKEKADREKAVKELAAKENRFKTDPTYVEWKAMVKAGLLLTTGNSQTASFTGGAAVSRRQGNNRFAFDGSIAYAKSSVLLATDANGDGKIQPTELDRITKDTANSWQLKTRYDRFFLESNSGYVTANVGRDVPAGKDIYAGGQVGYSRRLFKTKRHEMFGEIGYDFNYESYLTSTGGLDSNNIHSLRVFLGYKVAISKTAAGFINAEGLFNLNTENAPTADGSNKIDPFKDSRFNGKAGLTFNVWRNISFNVTYSLKYDNRPAPLPESYFAPLTFAAGNVPIAQKLDTITEAVLIINFL